MNKFLTTIFILCFSLQAQALEDFIMSTDSKISDIKIKDTSVININPLTTILNEKNTLFITPIKIGETSFSLQKNNKIFNFNVVVKDNETIISENDEFEIVSLDTHPQILDCEIDTPPVLKKKETINIDGAIIEVEPNSEVEE